MSDKLKNTLVALAAAQGKDRLTGARAWLSKGEKVIIEDEGDWWEVELSHYQNLTKPNHPFEEILAPLGLHELMPQIQKRLQDIFNEKLS